MADTEGTIEPDASQMRQHVGHLFEGKLDDCRHGQVELAWTDATDGKLRHAALFGTDELDDLIERAVSENRKKGQNTYIGQALRRAEVAPFARCRDADFLALTSFYVDLDSDVSSEAATIYRSRNCSPTGVIITGRHPHLRTQMLWRLETPVRDTTLCRQQNLALAQALRGDTSVVNASRVMRLGGSIAWPVKAGRIVERTQFLTFDDGRPKAYMPEAIARAFPFVQPTLVSLPSEVSTRPSVATPPLLIGSSSLPVSTCIAAVRAGEHWHDNMVRLVGHWIARGWSDAEILTAAEAMMRSLTLI